MQARENTEVMAMAMMAKRFPRNQIEACDKIRNAFTRLTLAEKAQYQFARGGSDIVGPSIRAAEAMSQQWGNMSNGWREVSRSTGPDGVGVSEVEAFSVDYESVNRESILFVVRHWRDTKRGGYKLTDERDIYELCANQAQRRKRACILAQLPGDIAEMAMEQASATLKSKADTSAEAMTRMIEAFAPFGVLKEHIEKRIQRRLDAISPAQVVTLKRIYASLRDDMSTPGDWFDIDPNAPPAAPPPPPPPPELKTMSAEDFDKKKAGWKTTVETGKKSANDLIATIQTKELLTDDQKMEVASWSVKTGDQA
jgi:hypothetical protein